MHNSRILVLTNGIGGLYSFRKEVIQALINNGYEVYISCPFEANLDKAEKFKQMGCKNVKISFRRQGMNPVADFKLMLRYRKLIKKINPVAVLTYTIKPNLYGGMACALCGVPQIANITGLGAAVEYPGIMQKFTIMLYKLGLRKTYMTFFQNESNRQFCISHKMVNGQTRLIPGSGVNLEYHAQQPYPAESEPIRFVFCSRIRKEKGIEEFIDTAKYIRTKYPNTQFDVLGVCEGDYEQRFAELKEQGVLTYHGRQSDVRPFFAQAHCTLHPTFYPEGMSNVLLESCATGRPIMTTNRPGCREAVDDGINGYIVNQQDSADLISKVEKFINLPYEQKKQMGEAARKKVEREFDRNQVVSAYLDTIKGLSK